jgi:hypothetical protein
MTASFLADQAIPHTIRSVSATAMVRQQSKAL